MVVGKHYVLMVGAPSGAAALGVVWYGTVVRRGVGLRLVVSGWVRAEHASRYCACTIRPTRWHVIADSATAVFSSLFFLSVVFSLPVPLRV